MSQLNHALAPLEQIDPGDYRRLAELIQDFSGIRLPEAKRSMVEGRLRRRLRALGMTSFAEYCDFLFAEDGLDSEHTYLIDAITTNKTDFFREQDHFVFLENKALPTLLAARKPGLNRPIKIWSAASSIGAEAYSIAMVLAEKSAGHQPFGFSVLGTDISTAVLEQAVTAVYPEEMMDPVPPALRERYVMQSLDRSKRVVRIVPELRRLVRFQRLNLMEERYPVDTDMDVIFCRNILIYFDKPTQHSVLRRLSRYLRQGGYLILGHAESMAGDDLPLHQIAPTIYYRT